MSGPMNIKLCNPSRRFLFTRRIQLLVLFCILCKRSLNYNYFSVSILQSLSIGILLFIIFEHSTYLVHSFIEIRCTTTDVLNYTSWALSTHIVINYVLYTYFWPTLYKIGEFINFIQFSALVGQ